MRVGHASARSLAVLISAFSLFAPNFGVADGTADEEVVAADAATADAVASGVATPDWLGMVERQIAEDEFHVTWQTGIGLTGLDEGWQAPNRAQGFRSYFTTEGLRVVPRGFIADDSAKHAPAWEWSLRLVLWGRPGDSQPVQGGTVRVSDNRIDYDRGEIIESYVNEPRGLEQLFTIARPPRDANAEERALPRADGSVVHLLLSLEGSLTHAFATDGQAVDFATGSGWKVIHYADLKVTDAAGRELRAWMEGFTGPDTLRGIRIAFEDEGAVYPVSVDPLATSPAWTAEGNQGGAQFGFSVATAGDVNGDGYSDVIVGAPRYDNGLTNEGRALVYLGSASGLASNAAWVAEINQASAEFGSSVATAGDVNRDGYSDVIVGAHLYDNGQADEGRALVYLGSSSGLAPSAAWTAEGNQTSAQFGASVAPAGDVNGDGHSDVIVGAPFHTNLEPEEGRAIVYFGTLAGLSPSPAWTAESNQVSARFGVAVGTAGDVNGDGYSDVIVGANLFNNGQADEGSAYVYLGSAAGPATIPAWTAESNQTSAQFGTSVATAGDVNGDGYSDVIVGAPLYDNFFAVDQGRAFVYYGSATGLAATAAWVKDSSQNNASFGLSVATAGDINGDGYADVIVGAYWYDNLETDEGRASVYLGSASGLAASPVWTAESNQAAARFGASVATAGDVNGDGYADVIVGAYVYDNGQTDEGRAYVYLGSAAGPAATAGWSVESNEIGRDFGSTVATAGDVNGDGYADVIVGTGTGDGQAYVFMGSTSGLAASPAWTAADDSPGAYFPWSVASAGDVNGDGYSDVIVSTRALGPEGNERAYVYHGSAAGLVASPAWTAEGEQPMESFGDSVATAGDVNGDGYSDVIVGAWGYDHDVGRAYVYLGSASGLATTAAWSKEGGQAHAFFGGTVATAGDVNGDGFSDVIIGATFAAGSSSDGRAYVYHGSAFGLAASPAWTAQSDQLNGFFGVSVATAGDVNGDGYSDVIVGEAFYDNGQQAEGRALVYLGSANGLGVSPAWTAEGNQQDAGFGSIVATAGDVNGDGYSDVVVSTSNSHINSIFLGSAAGLEAAAVWTAAGTVAGTDSAVGTAGDVNADGYADVILGDPMFSNGQLFEGQARVYYGNNGLGLSLRPQQRRTTNPAPIVHLGASDSPNSFRLNLLGRTPFGRSRVRLEREAKALGSLLNGTNTQVATTPQDTGIGGASLSELQTGLIGATPYHWRVRLRYDPARTPFAQRSRWLTVPWKGWQEAMLRTRDPGAAGAVPASAPGVPLEVARAGASIITTDPMITLTWGASCAGTDTDYAIYEGTLGAFYSHQSRFCSTGGETTKTFTPQAGGAYYLVVPMSSTREGSYGLRGDGTERPVGQNPCMSQAIASCP